MCQGTDTSRTQCYSQARSQDLEKGGGYFERVRKVQTTLTRNFIVLESVSHGLSENPDEISRKFKGFFRPKSGGFQKRKKVFAEIETAFSAEIRNSKVFSAQNQVVSKKKKVFTEIETVFWPKSEIQTFEGGLFSYGGLFSIFHKKSASKAPKTCDFAYFTTNGGGSSPPPPPWLRYWL